MPFQLIIFVQGRYLAQLILSWNPQFNNLMDYMNTSAPNLPSAEEKSLYGTCNTIGYYIFQKTLSNRKLEPEKEMQTRQ